MDSSAFQGVLAAVMGFNTLATFTLAFFVGVYKGNLDQWRSSVDKDAAEQKTKISEIHAGDTRRALIEAQIERQSSLIEILGKRTHDLNGVLAAANLTKGILMTGFDRPVTGAGD